MSGTFPSSNFPSETFPNLSLPHLSALGSYPLENCSFGNLPLEKSPFEAKIK